MLSLLYPLFASLPDEITQSLIPSLTLLFNSWASSGSLERPAHSSTSPSSTAQLKNLAGGSFGQAPFYRSGEKRRLPDGSESPGDGNEGEGNRKRLNLDSNYQGGLVRRWACPFYQRSPHRYCVQTEYGDFRKCAKSPGFREVHRVKYVWVVSDLRM
ncbi:hypothetical protein GP486_004144 [Trichoglossum hirsutum]|uniref:Uncharacterized protein n=1 Tax=Trichoglossum hirsutum TaxID=265104 RepID=A0A9P8RQ56_9PEZI|nr:hypothetical protein GP486_004144 [Trichoglossum hirsutum]